MDHIKKKNGFAEIWNICELKNTIDRCITFPLCILFGLILKCTYNCK